MRTEQASWQTGYIPTAKGSVPRVSTTLAFEDKLGALKTRLGFGRMKYTVEPGLYGIGNPDGKSPVLVTANYKLSFDRLRKELSGLDAWVLVLDTKGINVWCAAGKGTFGTDEVVNRVERVNLAGIVSHKKLILPQLGAPGVAAHEVTTRTGFKVIYGPVKARDILPFLRAGLRATPQMRTVGFSLKDRLTLTPIEIVGTVKILMIILGVLLLIDLLGLNVTSLKGFLPYVGAVLLGTVGVPALLPWIPGRAFAFKGWLLGMIFALAVNVLYGHLFSAAPDWKQALVYFLTLPAVSSFLAMNFTGSSTYTSLSGVVREMKMALPFIMATSFLGLALMVLKAFVKF